MHAHALHVSVFVLFQFVVFPCFFHCVCALLLLDSNSRGKEMRIAIPELDKTEHMWIIDGTAYAQRWRFKLKHILMSFHMWMHAQIGTHFCRYRCCMVLMLLVCKRRWSWCHWEYTSMWHQLIFMTHIHTRNTNENVTDQNAAMLSLCTGSLACSLVSHFEESTIFCWWFCFYFNFIFLFVYNYISFLFS